MIDLFIDQAAAAFVQRIIDCREFSHPDLVKLCTECFCVQTAYHLPYGTVPCPFCERNKSGHRKPLKNHYYHQTSYQTSLVFGYGGMQGSKREYRMKRPEQIALPKGKNAPCPDKSFREKYPTIAQYLCDEFWDDGKARKPSTMTINMAGGDVSISISDHEYEQSCYTTSETLQDALEALEDALGANKVTWRKWPKRK